MRNGPQGGKGTTGQVTPGIVTLSRRELTGATGDVNTERLEDTRSWQAVRALARRIGTETFGATVCTSVPRAPFPILVATPHDATRHGRHHIPTVHALDWKS